MGGIKNKSLLNKVINKVPLWQKGNVRRQSDKGIVSNNPSVSLRLTAPLGRGARMAEKSAPAKGRQVKTYGFQPVGLSNKWSSITKYTSIACLSLAILSTLVLNIVSSYSASNTLSRAEPMTRNVGPVVTGPAKISLSITSSSTSGSDLILSIPQDGGIATDRHTVSINTNTMGGFDLSLQSANDGSVLTNTDNSNYTIEPVNAQYPNYSSLGQNTWGYAISGWVWSMSATNGCTGPDDMMGIDGEQLVTQPKNDPTAFLKVSNQTTRIMSTVACKLASTTTTADRTINLYVNYGVRVDNPAALLAGNYTSDVVYTATVRPLGQPVIGSTTPDTYELGSNAGLDTNNRLPVTITGTNLKSTYEVYLENNADSSKRYDITDTIANISDTELMVTLPTDKTNSDLEPGDYTIHVVTQGGEASTGFTYTEKKALSVYDSVDNVRVDYDENMIPVKYVGYDGNGGGHWAVVTDTEVEQNTSNWFRYNTTERRWANAITVTAEAREAYRKKQTGEDPDPAILSNNNPTGNGEANPEILGYWVYIPRYAYEVQRRDAVDASVDPQNFNIVFQTADEKNSPAATCSTISSHKDYRTECGIPTTYTANSDNTTWTTHPAFTFGNTELNGIWVGKFETTGTRVNPTVKPNQHANISEPVGNFYTTAKHIGIYDKYNIGGNNVTGKNLDGNDVTLVAHTSTGWNSLHNLANATSHMLKNSEWGALTYLAHSDYGAGINSERTRATNVNKNGATATSSTDADGDVDTDGASAATGCGPASTGSDNSYTVSIQLNITTIESPSACGSADKAYNSSDGVLASTTNNIYGAYDTSGGVYEYVAGTRTSKQNSSESTNVMENEVTHPFVDLYRTVDSFGRRPSWASGGNSTESGYNFIVCTYELCGGTSTYETNISDNVPGIQNSWGFVASQFVWLDQQWFRRGGSASNDKVNPFYINPQNGQGYYYNGFRAVLILATDH